MNHSKNKIINLSFHPLLFRDFLLIISAKFYFLECWSSCEPVYYWTIVLGIWNWHLIASKLNKLYKNLVFRILIAKKSLTNICLVVSVFKYIYTTFFRPSARIVSFRFCMINF